LLRPALIGVAAVGVAFAALSANQLEAWRDNKTLRECISDRAGNTIFRPHMDAALAAAYFAEGSNQLAAATAQAALNQYPDMPMALLTLADVAQAEGHLDQALAGYERVLKLDPESLEAWVNRGVVLGKLGRLDESAVIFFGILETMPQHAGARQNLAYVLELQGKTNEMRLVMSGRVPPIKIAGR
jgi:tetratricopeptide (TPR) repeat protein